MTHSPLRDVDVQYKLSGQICSQVNHPPKHPRTPAAERCSTYTANISISFESIIVYFFLFKWKKLASAVSLFKQFPIQINKKYMFFIFKYSILP